METQAAGFSTRPMAAADSATARPEVEELELELLLEALLQRFGFDFRGHERSALKRKLRGAMARRGLRTLSSLQDSVLHDDGAAGALLRALHVPAATLFDDAQESMQLRALLGPALHASALPRVWLADCAGAEQAWTLAILLHEQGLLARTEIYATVASDELLAEAQQASLPPERLAAAQLAYARGGGSGTLADYFQAGPADDAADGQRTGPMPLPQLRDRITWAQYNLVTDASFNEFQLIVCRRALQDFGPLLRQRVRQLFQASLAPFGVLGLDRPLDANDGLAAHYQPLLPGQPWYKRTG
ncbi:CheR family methyltransferase [Rugamonas sp.]|uniref:CheR family methyltransferase n=1 Tax=Rugamonas sp. TaxID=1926287 RepID=UPI0025E6AF9C|nr:CheR family methyltransferase [Rugamonas sp.]